jgi:hypothetical protein
MSLWIVALILKPLGTRTVNASMALWVAPSLVGIRVSQELTQCHDVMCTW